MSQTIINGDSAEVLEQFESNTIDAVITDPPYGIEFLGKEWDKNTGAIDIWRECLRVLKPGGHLLAFSAARTYHHLATNIEQVGFEIRDQIMWIYASGFPKAQDIGKAIDRRLTKQKTDIRAEYNGGKHGPKNVDLGMQGVRCPVCKRDSNARYNCKDTECGMVYKAQSPEARQWSGWKTALKPAHEPIVMARKPMRGSTIDNVLEHGVGALNIDATRIATADTRSGGANGVSRLTFGEGATSNEDSFRPYTPNEQGRFPSNVVGEIPDHQKYFYCPKVSRRERHRGFEQHNIPTNPEGMLDHNGGTRYVDGGNKQHNAGNNHPTVKPVELMKYLVKLVTPQGSHIIDPFSGSGTTGMACRELGRSFTGIDLDPNYCAIARKRIAASQPDLSETLFE